MAGKSGGEKKRTKPPQHQERQPGIESEMRPRPRADDPDYRGSGKLAGKVAVITGGDSGIGRAVAIAFAREGADVAIAYLPDEEEDASRTVELVEKAGRRAVKIPGDLTDEQACQVVIDRTVRELGGIDILVNNAAYQMAQPEGLSSITTEQLDRVVKTNLYAMFWLSKQALPHLKEGAVIINTSSIQASQPSPELLDYAMTKAAIVNFTKGLAASLAERGIRVNAVAPGPVWTPLIPASNMDTESFGQNAPLKRAAQPAEMAPIYVLLASTESSYVTGMVYGATGGQLMP